MTTAVGYPLHRLVAFTEYRNRHGVLITEWRAACHFTGTTAGDGDRFKDARQAYSRELCRQCFPDGNSRGPYPEPERIGEPAIDLAAWVRSRGAWARAGNTADG